MVLAKSETLKYAMKSSDVRFQPEAVIIFPEFKKKSLVMMLQFLYTGEVGTADFVSFYVIAIFWEWLWLIFPIF